MLFKINLYAKEEIMANKKFWLGILVIVLVFAMTVVGCEDDDPPPVTKLTISNIPDEKTGLVSIMLYSTFSQQADPVAGGQGTISNKAVTDIPMQTISGNGWNGQSAGGSYMIFLVFHGDDSYYVYTDSKDFSFLEITSEADFNTKLPREYVGLYSSFNFNWFRNIADL
jgi:hypothetical protein